MPVRVAAFDHINIHTDDVPGTARFYSEMLGLQARAVPGGMAPEKAQWLVDGEGRAIIHLYAGPITAGPTGPLHHVALNCQGKAALIEKLQRRGIAFDAFEASAQLTQIFVRDPHGILLELRFGTEQQS